MVKLFDEKINEVELMVKEVGYEKNIRTFKK